MRELFKSFGSLKAFPPTTLQTSSTQVNSIKFHGISGTEDLQRNITDSHGFSSQPRLTSRIAAVQNFCVSLRDTGHGGTEVRDQQSLLDFGSTKLVPPIYS